jgi:imidazolonepropionase-like amidohydrolase
MTHPRMRFLSHHARWRIYASVCMVLLIVISAQVVKTEEPSVFAITNAKIIPVSGAPIEKGSIVIRRGIIEAVGADIAVPGDARIIDAAGLTVYPGLIDAFSDIGLEEPAAGRGATPVAATPVPGRGAQQAQQTQQPTIPPDERQGITPYRHAFEVINPANRKIESARAVGITTAAVMPRRGFFPGQGTLISLSGSEINQLVVKPATSFFINLGGRGGAGGGGAGYPGSLMGIIAFAKQTLMDADRYAAAWNIYRASPGAERPEYSRALEALQPVLKREVPVILPANSPAEIQRALDFADAFKLNLMLTGCAEGGKMASILKSRNIPVLLAVKYPDRPTSTDPDFREELDSLRRRVEAPANAAVLAKAGVRFALVSDDLANPRDFITNVGRAVEAGLDKDIAIRALTLIPAELLGVSDRFGTIEKNKTANLVLATGDIFDQKTRVKHVFIDGRKIDIVEQPASPSGATGRGGSGR